MNLEELVFTKEGELVRKRDNARVDVVPVGPPVVISDGKTPQALKELLEGAQKDATAYVVGSAYFSTHEGGKEPLSGDSPVGLVELPKPLAAVQYYKRARAASDGAK